MDDSKYGYTSEVKASEAVKFYDDKIADATMFTPKSKIAYCTSCGDEIEDFREIIGTTGNYTYEPVTGMWILTVKNSESKVEEIYYIDAVENQTTKSLSGKVICQSKYSEAYSDAKLLSDGSISLDSSSVGENVRALKVTAKNTSGEARYFWLTDSTKSGEYKVVAKTNDNYSGTDLLGEGDSATVAFVEGHNHRYDTTILGTNATDTEKAGNIYFDPNFEAMTYLNGLAAITDGNKNHTHYLECKNSDCGLKYYPVEHASEVAGTACSVCGFDVKEGKFLKVSIVGKSELYFALDLAKETAVTAMKKAYDDAEKAIAKTPTSTDETDAVYKAVLGAFNNASGNESESYLAVKSLETAAKTALDTTYSASTVETKINALIDAINALCTATKDKEATGVGEADGSWNGMVSALAAIGNGADDEALEKVIDAVDEAVAAKYITETFYVTPSFVLPLTDSSKFTYFGGYTVELADDTGWTVSTTSAKIVSWCLTKNYNKISR